MTIPAVTVPAKVLASDFPTGADRISGVFNAKAVAWANSENAMVTRTKEIADATYSNALVANQAAGESNFSAATAAAQVTLATEQATIAGNAAATAGAVLWVSGTTYAIGNLVYSPTTLTNYRRKTAGAGVTDPSLDGTNWTSATSATAWDDISSKPAVIAAGVDAAAARAAVGAGDVTLTGIQTLTNKTLTAPALGTPESGDLSNATADGTNKVGAQNIPQVSKSAAYTLVLADAGKHILHPSSDTTARTFTIPANSSVAFPIGTAITIINQNAAGVITIAITSDVMRRAGDGTTGSLTLAANGIVTLIKIATTEWIASGVGLP